MTEEARAAKAAIAIRGSGSARRIEIPILAGVPGLAHLFTTRGADTASAVAAAAGRDLPLVTLRQVHGAVVRLAEAGLPGAAGDALVVKETGLAVGVWVADCLPILICDESSRGLAAVHAGWRGTVAGVLGAAIAALRERFGAVPSSLRVAMGPAIGSCCFEVGDEVVEALLQAFPDAGGAVLPGPGRKKRLNLVELNRRQALAAGVLPARIQAADLCTRCLPDLLESYRRSGAAAGRTAAVIAWRD